MGSVISRLAAFADGPWLKTMALLALGWASLYFVCFLFGGLGLWQIGRKRKEGCALFAWLLGLQLYYEIRLCGQERCARRAEPLLWWWLTFSVAGVVCALWAVVGYVAAYAGLFVRLLGFLAALFLLFAAVLFLWVRVLEFSALRRFFKRNSLYWGISLVGTVLGLPLQRLFVFVLRNENR